ncbi:hypothetical protein COCON_G00119040 [Conger conger]|uniref:Tetraspanin n=1 Tax=Conger conger TaxID=82655 RepID=A0A9Q1DGG9_CONCO|nr:tetraspanin-8-like [Conger conger]KAJ8269297.1 hypothetical protein COCON_G00119040 [Conger conger]
MAIVNCCFKRVFIFFNILFGFAGIVLFGLGTLGCVLYKPPEGFEHTTSGILFLFLIGGATLALSVFGIYGAQKEKKWSLIVFFTGLVLGCLGLLLISMTVSVGIPMAVQTVDHLFYQSIPLDEASQDVQKIVKKLQPELKCCGVFNGYQDWGRHVPDSCLCSSDMDTCERINGSQLASHDATAPDTPSHDATAPDTPSYDSEKLVYTPPCGPLVTDYMHFVLVTILEVCIVFAIMAFVGMGMSMAMICRIRKGNSPVTFGANPSPPYTELLNASEA